jgi:hypothetical protein
MRWNSGANLSYTQASDERFGPETLHHWLLTIGATGSSAWLVFLSGSSYKWTLLGEVAYGQCQEHSDKEQPDELLSIYKCLGERSAGLNFGACSEHDCPAQ